MFGRQVGLPLFSVPTIVRPLVGERLLHHHWGVVRSLVDSHALHGLAQEVKLGRDYVSERLTGKRVAFRVSALHLHDQVYVTLKQAEYWEPGFEICRFVNRMLQEALAALPAILKKINCPKP